MKIAGPDGDISWLFQDGDYGYKDFVASVDALVMGRKTYETIQSFGDWPYDDKKTYVLSHATLVGDTPEGVEQYNGDIAKLDLSKHKHVWIVGGAGVAQQFLHQNLIDELILSIHPLILGDGIALFDEIRKPLPLKLEKSESFDSGLTQLTYGRP